MIRSAGLGQVEGVNSQPFALIDMMKAMPVGIALCHQQIGSRLVLKLMYIWSRARKTVPGESITLFR
jgi:hypothetical protein